jgi:hypothetical protein
MKVQIYLTVDGQEVLAQNSPSSLYPWHFSVQQVPSNIDLNKRYILVGEVDVELPAAKTCIPNVIAGLEAERDRVYAEAALQAKHLNERLQNVLSLTFEA